ncbi:uncharacterized protein AFUA_6G10640 [Aspergillus fumigatus Af293]|uniref:Uncharacterized protein n=1 Tax=Aspergillus fumigatus (strain ATCC MYA-4609 / CBS 101355 / FGSC A1100 / Af293) TaxID=330879 RepID=Q4WMA0_ASPFU|nr:hypothetical protein AFUA_6G10640 [Aspergillus fumigatus Af293]EAL88914.1 hypothetical protein AFUA_6G10640 [Aspergillus fumigatus Af293]
MQRENTHRPFDGSRSSSSITSRTEAAANLPTAAASLSSNPPTNPSKTPISSAPFSREISLRALRMASSSTFFIVPDTFITRNTHDRIFSAPAGAPFFIPPLLKSGTCDIYVRAVQTRRNDARGHRMIAVEVAGDKYLTIHSCQNPKQIKKQHMMKRTTNTPGPNTTQPADAPVPENLRDFLPYHLRE